MAHSLFLVKFCAVAVVVVVVVVVTIFICRLWPSGLARFLAKSFSPVGVSLLPATFVSLCTHTLTRTDMPTHAHFTHLKCGAHN